MSVVTMGTSSTLADYRYQRRKGFGDARGVHMAARPDGYVESIESYFSRDARQFSAFEELQVF
jgi:hypothetical protein